MTKQRKLGLTNRHGINHTLLDQIKTLLKDDHVYKLHTVQTLWSGYGEIARYVSPRLGKHLIVKQVSPPDKVHHPRGWNSDVGHQRKVNSYQNEALFYSHYAQLCDEKSRVADLIAGTYHTHNPQHCLLVLEDLDQAGYAQRRTKLSRAELAASIKWLAYFHARFINIKVDDLWSVGTYWHLSTRQDEFNAMQAGPLKSSACEIDHILNKAQFKNLSTWRC